MLIKANGLKSNFKYQITNIKYQNWGILKNTMDQKRDHMKINFDYFQIHKWMLQTVRAEKVDE